MVENEAGSTQTACFCWFLLECQAQSPPRLVCAAAPAWRSSVELDDLISPPGAEMVTALDSTHPATSYAEMARRPLEAEQCVLVVIDIQEKLLPPIFQKEQLVRNSQLLIRAASILKMPVLMTTQYAKGLGQIVPEIASLLPEGEAIDKQLFSCFGSDAFCSLLKRLPGQRNTLLLCGMESHICVAQTALAGLREGYLVHVASDAVSSRTDWN